MVKEAKKRIKERKSQKRSRSYQRHKNKREDSSSSRERKESPMERAVWIFGLPWSIKGKEVSYFLEHKHPGGAFYVIEWKWVKLRNSSCEFMEVVLDARKVGMCILRPKS